MLGRCLRCAPAAYDRALNRRPLLVKMVTSGAIVSGSDITVQAFAGGKYDPVRSAIVGIGYGGLYLAPVLHCVTSTWARLLPSTGILSVGFKTLVDSITAAPVNLCAMLGFQVLAGKQELSYDVIASDVPQAVSEKLWPSLLASWMVWPPFIVVNYKFVPLPYRVLFLNCVSFVWNIFIIWRCTDVSPSGEVLPIEE
ncbi:unnamed protein product [Polarella glacialis]|uniref:Protein Mpv17 n=1 Tax=Polarella glacialis TaxID=89957 RepID=A0A813JX44_POLGL|nr:unnamed protein product [Polarella glacialis]CAE8720209.1 unnamed protein product [Polarella glacialis]